MTNGRWVGLALLCMALSPCAAAASDAPAECQSLKHDHEVQMARARLRNDQCYREPSPNDILHNHCDAEYRRATAGLGDSGYSRCVQSAREEEAKQRREAARQAVEVAKGVSKDGVAATVVKQTSAAMGARANAASAGHSGLRVTPSGNPAFDKTGAYVQKQLDRTRDPTIRAIQKNSTDVTTKVTGSVVGQFNDTIKSAQRPDPPAPVSPRPALLPYRGLPPGVSLADDSGATGFTHHADDTAKYGPVSRGGYNPDQAVAQGQDVARSASLQREENIYQARQAAIRRADDEAYERDVKRRAAQRALSEEFERQRDALRAQQQAQMAAAAAYSSSASSSGSGGSRSSGSGGSASSGSSHSSSSSGSYSHPSTGSRTSTSSAQSTCNAACQREVVKTSPPY